MKCTYIEPKAFVRLGRPLDGKQRIIKVILDSVTNKHQLLGGVTLLRTKDGDGNSSQDPPSTTLNPHNFRSIYTPPGM